jgi:hypothetical protein
MPQSNAAQIIAAWRAAERRLETLEPGTREHAEAAADVDRRRREYHEALAALKVKAERQRRR